MKKPIVIEVFTREWFDRVNGNSYFAGKVNVIFKKDNICFDIPFQYGYGEYYLQAACELLNDNKIISTKGPLWRYCDEHNIRLLYHKAEHCLKRELTHMHLES